MIADPELRRPVEETLAGLTDRLDVFITLTENESIDWSFGDGLAQYAL